MLRCPVFYAMYLMFFLLAACAAALFVLISALYFGVYGEILSLFLSELCT